MSNQTFKGNIMRCTKYDKNEIGFGTTGCSCRENQPATELYKENATLIKIGNHYVDIDVTNNYLGCLLLILIKKGLTTNYSKKDQLFVDKKTLKPFYNNVSKTKIKGLRRI